MFLLIGKVDNKINAEFAIEDPYLKKMQKMVLTA